MQKNFFSRFFASKAVQNRAQRGSFGDRKLRLESLENRELLDANPIVNTDLDVVDAGDNLTSLREAIASVDAGGVIQFDASMAGKTIKLNSTLDITKAMTIDGGALNVTINAQNGRRAFNVYSGDSDFAATLNGLNITGGNSGSSNGGLIYNGENLTITGSRLSSGTTTKFGGIIYNASTLT
ncbi:MAG: hypothetical protein HUK22_01775, partial [Thermoguttaceae bacterium]|nr:hypothetical protein [Thermoguttaceae bacterium]